MLSPASWEPQARLLPMNGKARVDHDCGPGRTLTVRSDDRGLHAFCFRCNDHGWLPPAPVPLSVRLERLREASAIDGKLMASVELPGPAVRDWDEWPVKARLWLVKAGLSRADLPRLGAYYHPPSDRVVLPVLDGLTAVFWQARALDGRQPKYLAPDVGKSFVIARYGKADSVTLTEDLLSAYKVGTVAEGWSLLGTKISDHIVAELVKRGCKVNVWLDPDPPGQRAATKVLRVLRSVGLEAHNIVSARDPKLIHKGQIKELLNDKRPP